MESKAVCNAEVWQYLLGEKEIPVPEYTLSRVLVYSKNKPLMVGTDVEGVQTKLIEAGYSCGKQGADSQYGAATVSAVKKFQKAKGLKVDGKVGKGTCTALGIKWLGD